jgi:hypothetical protein
MVVFLLMGWHEVSQCLGDAQALSARRMDSGFPSKTVSNRL